MRKSLILLSVVVVCAISLIAQTRSNVTVKGSDTMVILAQRWAEKYMAANSGRTVQVTGGGSGTGFAAMINGTTDICNASRPIKKSEIEKIKQKHGAAPVETAVAVDGIAIYVHKSNPVKELSIKQIKGIYTGTINNWKELGGSNTKIIKYGRENSSGTFEFFREHVLDNADYATAVQTLPGTGAVVHAVSNDKNGIGYGGAAYGKGITYVKVRADTASQSYEPTPEHVIAGTYPLSRYLYMYTIRQPEGALKEFLEYVLSEAGQKLVEEVGYFPLPVKK